MTEANGQTQNGLFKYVGDLRNFSMALTALGEFAPDRMTIPQAVFFLTAAAADLAGRPATFGDIRELVGPILGRSLHTTYKVFLDGSRRRDRASGPGLRWLEREPNPDDERAKFLRLTPEGERVIRAILMTITGKADL